MDNTVKIFEISANDAFSIDICFVFCNNMLAVNVPKYELEECVGFLKNEIRFGKKAILGDANSYAYNSYYFEELIVKYNEKSNNIVFSAHEAMPIIISDVNMEFKEWLEQCLEEYGFEKREKIFKAFEPKIKKKMLGCIAVAVVSFLLFAFIPVLWPMLLLSIVLVIVVVCIVILEKWEDAVKTVIYKK